MLSDYRNRRARRAGAVSAGRRWLEYIVLLTSMAIPAAPAFSQPPCRTAVEAPDFAFAAGCLVRDGERMLAVRHRFGGRLGFPGGRARSGESAQCVAHRETWEETGVEVVVHEMLKRFGNGFALYRCEAVDSAAATIEVPASGRNEVTGVLWIDPRDTRPEDWRFPRDHREVLKLLRD